MTLIDDARDEIARYLPVGHPALDRLDKAIDSEADPDLGDITEPEPVEATESYDRLVDLLEDFRRGVRTWDEIEDFVWPALP